MSAIDLLLANIRRAIRKAPMPVVTTMKLAPGRPKDHAIVVCLSGRGDKDAAEIARLKESQK